MNVLENNCVSTIEVPSNVGSAEGFDYNPVLNLYATFNYENGLSVWEPRSGKVVAQVKHLGMNLLDTLFLPGDRVGISSFNYLDRGAIHIFNLSKGQPEPAELVIDEDLPVPNAGALALSPERNLLVTDPVSIRPRYGVHEIFMDWDTLKVLKSREIILGDENGGVWMLSCSQDFQVSTYIESADDSYTAISTAKVCFNPEGEVQIEEQQTITKYMLDGEETTIERVGGLVHDGQNLIIANTSQEEIVLLESMIEGSNAHLVASDCVPFGQMRINHEGQLMVSKGTGICSFEYKCDPRSLQDLCRCSVRKTIHTDYQVKLNSLPISCMLKNYLLYK